MIETENKLKAAVDALDLEKPSLETKADEHHACEMTKQSEDQSALYTVAEEKLGVPDPEAADYLGT
jgi:hypothetical protein